MKRYSDEFLKRVEDHVAQPTAKSGIPWPKEPLQRWVLAWLECRGSDTYVWPRWAVAEEATEATYAYYEHVIERPMIDDV